MNTEEKEIREKLRANRLARKQLKNKVNDIREERVRLKNVRMELQQQAEKLGLRVGRKKTAA